MKKHFPIITVALLISLFIYVFYRTDKTLVNQLIISLFSRQSYSLFKENITTALPMPGHLVYSLPEGLWIFCITITSSCFYLQVKNKKWSLVLAPLIIAVIMELFQLFHFSAGRFDIMDIAFAAAFWMLALFWTGTELDTERLFQRFNTKTAVCIFSYVIVYLAHVFY